MAKSDPELITKQTYEDSASALAEYFSGIGPRNTDIDLAIELADKVVPKVLELGCGDGRDAEYILSRTDDYLGIDYSSELIKIAQRRNSAHANKFVVSDIRDLPEDLPTNHDIIFAFASLLHLNPNDLRQVLNSTEAQLAVGGILYLSMKLSQRHQEVVKDDRFGRRIFHYYHPDEVVRMAPLPLVEEHRDFQTIGDTDWFTIALSKEYNEDD